MTYYPTIFYQTGSGLGYWLGPGIKAETLAEAEEAARALFAQARPKALRIDRVEIVAAP